MSSQPARRSVGHVITKTELAELNTFLEQHPALQEVLDDVRNSAADLTNDVYIAHEGIETTCDRVFVVGVTLPDGRFVTYDLVPTHVYVPVASASTATE